MDKLSALLSENRTLCAEITRLTAERDAARADAQRLAEALRMVFSPLNDDEERIVDAIVKRFHEGGGMTPAISKKIGWER